MSTARPDAQSRAIACLAVPSLAFACELAGRPGLAGTPVALSDEAHVRVVGVTREARQHGVQTGMTLRQAAGVCPTLNILEPRPALVLRSELVVDALEMACWRRRPQPGQTVVHSDRGSQYTAWAFGQRLRSAGLLGSMGRVASALDNSMMESFFGTMQRELLDRKAWATRTELARAIFEWIEGWYNPRRHTSIGGLSPVEYERSRQAAADAA